MPPSVNIRNVEGRGKEILCSSVDVVGTFRTKTGVEGKLIPRTEMERPQMLTSFNTVVSKLAILSVVTTTTLPGTIEFDSICKVVGTEEGRPELTEEKEGSHGLLGGWGEPFST